MAQETRKAFHSRKYPQKKKSPQNAAESVQRAMFNIGLTQNGLYDEFLVF